MRPAEDMAFGTWATDLTSKILAAGKLEPLPVKMMPKGLESVSDGIKYMMEGKVCWIYFAEDGHVLKRNSR
jgi:hypothetical protein